jgi:hypothetical protein
LLPIVVHFDVNVVVVVVVAFLLCFFFCGLLPLFGLHASPISNVRAVTKMGIAMLLLWVPFV